MSIKVANIRLELDEPEEGLPEKIAARLGLGPGEIDRSWRILRKSLDARGHDDVHFAYAAEVELPDEDQRASIASPSSGRSALRARALRLARAGPAAARASAGHRRRRARPACSPAICWRETGYRPLILERGRAVKDRVADVRRFDEGGPLDPESNYLFGEGGAGHVQRRQADLPRHRPRRPPRPGNPRRVPRQAVDRLRAPAAPRLQPPAAGRPDPPAQVRGAGRRGPLLLPGRGPRHRRRPAPRAGDLVGLHRRRRWRSWRSATAPATPTACCCAAACRWRPSRFSSACGSSSRRRRSTGAVRPQRRPPGPGRGRLQRVGPRRRPRPVHLLHVRRRLRHAQRQRAGLLLHQRHEREPARFAVRQQRPGRHDRARRDRQRPSPGGRPLPAAGRAAGLPGRRADLRGADPVGPRLPRGPAEPGHDPDQLSPRRHGRSTWRLFLPDPVVEALRARAAA